MIVSPILAWLPFEKSGVLCGCIEIFFVQRSFESRIVSQHEFVKYS